MVGKLVQRVMLVALLFCASTVFATVTVSNTPTGCAVDENGAGYGTWDAATNTCTLTRDIVATSVYDNTYAPAVSVVSDGVTLDCNGHVLSNSEHLVDSNGNSNTGDAITLSTGNDITVKNCVINDSEYGIYSYFFDTNLKITGNNITVRSIPISLTFPNSVEVSNNIITGVNGNGLALFTEGFSASVVNVLNNTISGVNTGLEMENIANSVIEGNRVYDVTGNGIRLSGCSNTAVRSNTVIQNNVTDTSLTPDLIVIEGGSSNIEVSGNVVENNNLPGTYEEPAGFKLYNAQQINFHDNVAGGNTLGVYAAQITDSSLTNNLIENNTVGMSLDTATNVVVTGNAFHNNGLDIRLNAVDCSDTIKDNTYSTSGSYLLSSEPVNLNGGSYSAVYLCDGSAHSSISGTTIGSLVLSNSDYTTMEGVNGGSVQMTDTDHASFSNGQVSGMLLLTNSNYNSITGTSVVGYPGIDLESSSGNALSSDTISYGGLTLGAGSNNNTVNGVTITDGTGVTLSGSANSLSNINLGSNGGGLNLNGVADCTNKLVNITLPDNKAFAYYTKQVKLSGGSYGMVFICGAKGSTLNKVTSDQITLVKSPSTTVTKATAGSILVVNSPKTSVVSSNADITVRLTNGCTLSGNSAPQPGFSAIMLDNAKNCNVAFNKDLQIVLMSASDNMISGNKVNGSITLQSSSDGNTITKNDVSGFGDAVTVVASNGNVISSNVLHDSNEGVFLVFSANNMLSKNTVKNNGNNGINLNFGSTNNTISGNVVSNNAANGGRAGIYMFYGADNNVLSGNTLSNNAAYGVVLDGPQGTALSRNTFSNNAAGGIYISGSFGPGVNDVTGNNLCNMAGTDITNDNFGSTGDRNFCSTTGGSAGWTDSSAQSGCKFSCRGSR